MDISKLARLACVLSAVCCPAEGLAPCPVGYMPPECQQQCGFGSFGVNCASLCPATCTDGSCEPDTGFCYTCQAGFRGPKCSSKCHTGFFGEGCKRPCPVNCFQNECDPFTGFCERCVKGYGGAECEQRIVLLNSSARAVMLADSHASGTMESTDKSVVVYVLVVIMCCVLPVCAVVLCVKCSKKFSSRVVQQDEKAPTLNQIPVSLSAHPRRPGRLTLKYEQMQTIEEESSNQLTPDEEIHQLTASNPTTASVTTLNGHDGSYTPSKLYTFESPKTTALNSTNRKINSKDLYNYQAMNIFSKECNPSFNVSHTTKEIQGFEADDVYNQSLNVCEQLQSIPVNHLGKDDANNLILADLRSHKSAQACFADNEQCMYDRDGSLLSLNSDTSHVRPYSPTSGTHVELAPKMLRRASSSAMAGSHPGLVSEKSRRVPSSAIAKSHMELVSETPRHGTRSTIAESHMELVSETPRHGTRSTIAESHMELVSETPRLGTRSAMSESHMEFVSETPRHGTRSAMSESHKELVSEIPRFGTRSAMAESNKELVSEIPRLGTRSAMAESNKELVSETPRLGARSDMAESHKETPRLGTRSAMAGSHMELISETPRLGTRSVMAESHTRLASEVVRRDSFSAMAESHKQLASEMFRRDSSPALAGSHIGLASEMFRGESSSPMAGSHMKFTSEEPRCIISAAIAGSHTEPTSKDARCMLPGAATAAHVQQIDHLDPETTVRMLPSECYSSSQEFVQGFTQALQQGFTQDLQQGFTQDPEWADLVWHQAQAITQAHNTDGDMVASDLFADTGAPKQDYTNHEAAPVPYVEKNPRDPEAAQSVCQPALSDNDHVVTVGAFPEFSAGFCAGDKAPEGTRVCTEDGAPETTCVCTGDKTPERTSVCTGYRAPETAGVCTGDKTPETTGVCTGDRAPETTGVCTGDKTLETTGVCTGDKTPETTGVCIGDKTPEGTSVCTGYSVPEGTCVCTGERTSRPDVPAHNEETEPGDRLRPRACLADFASDNRPIIAAVSPAVSIPTSPAVCTPVSIPVSPPACIHFSISASPFDCTLVSIPVSPAVSTSISIPASPVDYITVSIPVSPAVCTPVSPAVCTPVSPAVCSPVSPAVCTPVSPAFSTAVSIPTSPADCIPVSIPVSADVTTAVLPCRQVREEGQTLDGPAQDTTRRHTLSMDDAHARIRHAFECATNGYNVFQDSAPNDRAVEEENTLASDHDDQHSGDVCERAGHTISSSTEHDPSARGVSVNGSANNTNRFPANRCLQIRPPQSSSTTSPSTPAREMRHMPLLYLSCTEPIKHSDTAISQSSVPLFSIYSSAPVNFKFTYCKNTPDAPSSTLRHPRFVSLSSLDLRNDCPPQSYDPIEAFVRLPSPPKDQTKCSKGRRSEAFRHDLEAQVYLEASKPGISHQHKLPAVKCDKFRQVVYRKGSLCTHRAMSLGHLSGRKDSKISKQTCRTCGARSVAANKKQPHGSAASNYACPFVPISRALDENPLRENVVPEARNTEPLIPASAIKLSLSQTPDRDVPQLHTPNRGADTLPSTLTNDQEAQKGESTPVLKPLTFYIEELPLTSKDSGLLGQCVEKRASNRSKNSHFLLMQGLTSDRDLRRLGPDERTQTCGVPSTGPLLASGQPRDNIRNSFQVVSSTAFSTSGDTTRKSTTTDGSARMESSRVACQRATTLTNYYPDLRELGSSQHRPPTVTIDNLWYRDVRDDPSLTAELPRSDSRQVDPPTSSLREVNVEGRLAVEELMPTQVKVQENVSTTDERYQSRTPGHDLPPSMYPRYIKLQHNRHGSDNCAHKAKSGSGMPPILKSADSDLLTLYPLPSLLEDLAIWERTDSAVETSTGPCLLPIHDCDIMVDHPATDRATMKATDYGQRPPDGNVVCLDLCSQELERSHQFSQHDFTRLKPKPTICSSHQKIDGAAHSITVGRKDTAHKHADDSGSFHGLSECCKSKSHNKLSLDETLCCRKESAEDIQLPQEQLLCCSKASSEGSQLAEDKPVHYSKDSSDGNQLLQDNPVHYKNSSSERNQLPQDKPVHCKNSSSERNQLPQDKLVHYKNSSSERNQLPQDKPVHCKSSSSERNQLPQDKPVHYSKDSSEGNQLPQHKQVHYKKSSSKVKQLAQDTPVHCKNSSSERNQLPIEKPLYCRKETLEGIQLSQDKPVYCRKDCSKSNQLPQEKHRCCRKDKAEGVQLTQEKYQCYRQDNSEGAQLRQECQCCRRNSPQRNKLTKDKRQCCQQDNSEYISCEDSCDIFFDALDRIPEAFLPKADFKLQDHNDGLIMRPRDRERAVQFMETPARKTSDVDYGDESREQAARRQWREARHTDNERLRYSLSKRQTPQENIAFRFAVPRSAESTMSTFQTSASPITERRRRSKPMCPTEEKDQPANQSGHRHGEIHSAKVSLYEQTEQKTRPFTKKRHSGSNTGCSLAGVEGTVPAIHRFVSSETGRCSVGDQQSESEDFFSICE